MSDAELLLVVEARKKSGLVAALLNLFLPGAGYIYCGRWILGIVAFIFTVALIIYSLGLAVVGVVLMLIIDGFLCAGRYNQNVIKQALHERASGEGAEKYPPVPNPVSLHEQSVQSSAQERLTKRLDNAEVVDAAARAGTDQVFFGATVTYLSGTGEARTVTIVTPPAALRLAIEASNSQEPRVEALSSQQALTEPGSSKATSAATGIDRTNKVDSRDQNAELMESVTTNIDNSGTQVRAKPDTNAEVVKVLPPDTVVWIKHEAYKPNDWTEVRLAEIGPVLGWVRNDRLHDFRTEKQ